MENHVPIEFTHAVLLNEWDKVYDNASWRKDVELRRSKPFQIGYKLIRPVKRLKK